MRTKIVKRHYCDYCGKGMFKIPSMERHERGCTANPDRACKMCVLLKQKQPLTKDLIEFCDSEFSITASEEFEARLIGDYRKLCGGCPACMLTGIRLSARGAGAFGYGFDFKEELTRFWKDRDEEQRKAEEHSVFIEAERSWL